MTYALAILGMIVTVAGLVVGAIVWVTSEKRWLSLIGFILMLLAFLALVITREAHATDLKPTVFPVTEYRQLEQELANKRVKREVLPTKAQALKLGYGCGGYDEKITRLVEIYSQLNRNEMARQWRLHLGHIWEFSLNFCEDVEHHDRYKVAHKLYREAGDEMRMRRVAMKESKRLRRLYDFKQCDELGNCRKRLLKEVATWEKRATY